MTDWRRAVVFTHRWLGIVGGLLFAAWFVSGIVMMYARMPELARTERLARLVPLDLSAARVPPLEAVEHNHLVDVRRLRVGMLTGRPVYRVLSGREWTTIFADTGERFDGLSAQQAIDEARRLAPEHAATIRYSARLTVPDQWTLENPSLLPMHRVALGDPDDSTIYLAEATGEVVVKTTARERRLAYAGAVVHWLYFTPFRRHPRVWNDSIIGLSIAGSFLCLLGLVWGLYVGLASPYRGWMQWHHYAGLLFGLVSFTWIFSGLLSLDPWDWHPSTTPTQAQRDAFSGGPLRLQGWSPGGRELPLNAKEIEVDQFRGELRPVVDDRSAQTIDRDALVAAARDAMPGVPIDETAWLDDYDSYYYDRRREQTLPVLRIQYADSARTWLYVDPSRGTILRREERMSRLNRWLYHGLHSLDFPFLYARRPLWDIVVILLSLGGITSVATSLVPAWRRLRRHARRLYS